jgi:hypothetical protein
MPVTLSHKTHFATKGFQEKTVDTPDLSSHAPSARRKISNIYKPFFSTRESNKSLGLGLSVVYGIINNHHGSGGFTAGAGGPVHDLAAAEADPHPCPDAVKEIRDETGRYGDTHCGR